MKKECGSCARWLYLGTDDNYAGDDKAVGWCRVLDDYMRVFNCCTEYTNKEMIPIKASVQIAINPEAQAQKKA